MGRRYESGRNSELGSYGYLAEHKTVVLNTFVAENNVASIIGFGDEYQLPLAHYPDYIVYDISPDVIAMCRGRFCGDALKQLFHIRKNLGQKTESFVDFIFTERIDVHVSRKSH